MFSISLSILRVHQIWSMAFPWSNRYSQMFVGTIHLTSSHQEDFFHEFLVDAFYSERLDGIKMDQIDLANLLLGCPWKLAAS